MKYIIFLCCLSLFSACNLEDANYRDNIIAPLKINGVILTKYKTISCYGEIVYKNAGNIDTLKNLCYCVMEHSEDIWVTVMPGDSIFKQSNSLVFTTIRRGFKQEFKFPYCDK